MYVGAVDTSAPIIKMSATDGCVTTLDVPLDSGSVNGNVNDLICGESAILEGTQLCVELLNW